MELKPGYKQTEVGVIPIEWDVIEIGNLNPFITSGSRGWADFYSDRGVPFIRITNMSRDSIYLDLSDLKLVNLPSDVNEGTRTHLQDGDILISITADIGIACYVDASIPKPAYINQHIALVRFDPNRVNSHFFSYFLAGENSQKLFRGSTDLGAKAGMSLLTVRKIRLAIPPLPEQRAIAQSLSDVDALIAVLDQLITKKRNIKQGTMQQLLTGKKRLPGFSGEWEVKKLEKVAPLQRGFDLPNSQLVKGNYPVVYSNGILNFHNKYQATAPGVVTGRSGTIGKVTFVEEDYWPHNTSLWVTDFKANAPKFIYYLYVFIGLERFGTGSGVPTLNRNDVHAFQIPLPPTQEEQKAIAQVLSDMDAEIEALEQKRDKYKAIKQGMMQELLTGKTRLQWNSETKPEKNDTN